MTAPTMEVGKADLPASQAEATERTRLADKRLATVRAELALRGYALHILSDGQGRAKYEVGRWGASRTLSDMEAVEVFAVRVGARCAP
jgi:hypothetical protein